MRAFAALAMLPCCAALDAGAPAGMCTAGELVLLDELAHDPEPAPMGFDAFSFRPAAVDRAGEGWALWSTSLLTGPDGARLFDASVRFLSPTFEPVTEPVVAGRGELGPTLATPGAAYALLHVAHEHELVRVSRGGEVSRQPLRPDVFPVREGFSGLRGEDLALDADGRVVALLSGQVAACGSASENNRRFFLGFEDGRVVGPLGLETEFCGGSAYPSSRAHLIGWDDGTFGVVYRRRGIGASYARVTPSGDPVGPTRQVGGVIACGGGGNGLVAARLGDERVIVHDPGCGSCGTTRVFDADGDNVHDGWQPRCDAEGELRDNFIERVSLAPHATGATMVWEHRDARHIVADEAPFEEGVFIALLDEGGRLASPVEAVTGPGATARSEPITQTDGDVVRYVYEFGAHSYAGDGHTWVLWRDLRSGLSFREMSCAIP